MPKSKKSEEKLNIEPLNSYLALEIEVPEKKTKSGLMLPDTSVGKPNHGKVVAVSKEIQDKVSVGDIIYFPQYLGVEVEIKDKHLIMVKYEDLSCRVK